MRNKSNLLKKMAIGPMIAASIYAPTSFAQEGGFDLSRLNKGVECTGEFQNLPQCQGKKEEKASSSSNNASKGIRCDPNTGFSKRITLIDQEGEKTVFTVPACSGSKGNAYQRFVDDLKNNKINSLENCLDDIQLKMIQEQLEGGDANRLAEKPKGLYNGKNELSLNYGCPVQKGQTDFAPISYKGDIDEIIPIGKGKSNSKTIIAGQTNPNPYLIVGRKTSTNEVANFEVIPIAGKENRYDVSQIKYTTNGEYEIMGTINSTGDFKPNTYELSRKQLENMVVSAFSSHDLDEIAPSIRYSNMKNPDMTTDEFMDNWDLKDKNTYSLEQRALASSNMHMYEGAAEFSHEVLGGLSKDHFLKPVYMVDISEDSNVNNVLSWATALLLPGDNYAFTHVTSGTGNTNDYSSRFEDNLESALEGKKSIVVINESLRRGSEQIYGGLK